VIPGSGVIEVGIFEVGRNSERRVSASGLSASAAQMFERLPVTAPIKARGSLAHHFLSRPLSKATLKFLPGNERFLLDLSVTVKVRRHRDDRDPLSRYFNASRNTALSIGLFFHSSVS